MLKRILLLLTIVLSATRVSAFDFDGIDLNRPYIEVAQAISKLGYSYDGDRNCLRGFCQGTEIYISINYIDVTKKRMIGQFIVEIPIEHTDHSYTGVTTLFNVIYHQVDKDAHSITYQVDKDGTQLVVSQKGNSIFLTYNTPYYKYRKKPVKGLES